MEEKEKVSQFWLENANEDWEFAQDILKSEKQLHNALFFGQMALEKTLKALHYHKQNNHPLYIHDLVVLAERAGLVLTDEWVDDLKIITGFNVSARYVEYKQKVRKIATKEYVDLWMNKISEIRDYLLGQFK